LWDKSLALLFFQNFLKLANVIFGKKKSKLLDHYCPGGKKYLLTAIATIYMCYTVFWLLGALDHFQLYFSINTARCIYKCTCKEKLHLHEYSELRIFSKIKTYHILSFFVALNFLK
jgi:hypothetical protein